MHVTESITIDVLNTDGIPDSNGDIFDNSDNIRCNTTEIPVIQNKVTVGLARIKRQSCVIHAEIVFVNDVDVNSYPHVVFSDIAWIGPRVLSAEIESIRLGKDPNSDVRILRISDQHKNLVRCECGSEKVKIPTHSYWCPAYHSLSH